MCLLWRPGVHSVLDVFFNDSAPYILETRALVNLELINWLVWLLQAWLGWLSQSWLSPPILYSDRLADRLHYTQIFIGVLGTELRL